MQANKIIHLFQPHVPQLEFEANRFRGSLLILGHTNKQIEITTFKYANKSDIHPFLSFFHLLIQSFTHLLDRFVCRGIRSIN